MKGGKERKGERQEERKGWKIFKKDERKKTTVAQRRRHKEA